MAALSKISIHTPHAGSDVLALPFMMPSRISIHTPHAGSDTVANPSCIAPKTFQSTLPMRGATQILILHIALSFNFNPHSPCGERLSINVNGNMIGNISIHTPHAGSDAFRKIPAVPARQFQSTLPMRGATRYWTYNSIRALISIHTPHAGSDG